MLRGFKRAPPQSHRGGCYEAVGDLAAGTGVPRSIPVDVAVATCAGKHAPILAHTCAYCEPLHGYWISDCGKPRMAYEH